MAQQILLVFAGDVIFTSFRMLSVTMDFI
jgi:hypothetical protein